VILGANALSLYSATFLKMIEPRAYLYTS